MPIGVDIVEPPMLASCIAPAQGETPAVMLEAPQIKERR